MFKKIINSLSKWETIHLVMLPVAIGLLPLFGFLLLGSAGYRDTPIQYFLVSLMFFSWGFMGLPMIVRKEVPWLIVFRGWVAVVEGVALLVMGWGLAIGFMVIMFKAK
jgi:hypothetical protein